MSEGKDFESIRQSEIRIESVSTQPRIMKKCNCHLISEPAKKNSNTIKKINEALADSMSYDNYIDWYHKFNPAIDT